MGRSSNTRNSNSDEAAEVEGFRRTAVPGAWSASLSGNRGSCLTRPESQSRGSAWDSGTCETRSSRFVLSQPGAPSLGPNTGPAYPEASPVRLCPSPELMVLGLAASRPGHLPGAQGHREGCRLSAASASSRSMGSGTPSLLSPHAEEEEEKEGSSGSPPGQLPLASASLDSDRGRKRRLLPPPGAQPGNTLFMLSQSSCPHPPEAQFQPRAQGGRRGSTEGRATHKRGRPGPQPFAAGPRGAACTFPS